MPTIPIAPARWPPGSVLATCASSVRIGRRSTRAPAASKRSSRPRRCGSTGSGGLPEARAEARRPAGHHVAVDVDAVIGQDDVELLAEVVAVLDSDLVLHRAAGLRAHAVASLELARHQLHHQV